MTKLHEILAVEAGLKKTARDILAEGEHTFEKRGEHFSGHVKTYINTVENDPWEAEEGVVERQELVTTVHDKLAYIFKHLVRHIDCMATKDSTNQSAKADIVIGDQVLVADVPVTTLLSLEDEIKRWRQVIASVPTLAPGKEWILAADLGDNIFKLRYPEKKVRARKVMHNHVVAKATKEHPEQVRVYNEENPVGVFMTERISGAITPAAKSAMLGKVDIVFRAVKQSRMRANSTQVTQVKIANELANFILSD